MLGYQFSVIEAETTYQREIIEATRGDVMGLEELRRSILEKAERKASKVVEEAKETPLILVVVSDEFVA